MSPSSVLRRHVRSVVLQRRVCRFIGAVSARVMGAVSMRPCILILISSSLRPSYLKHTPMTDFTAAASPVGAKAGESGSLLLLRRLYGSQRRAMQILSCNSTRRAVATMLGYAGMDRCVMHTTRRRSLSQRPARSDECSPTEDLESIPLRRRLAASPLRRAASPRCPRAARRP
jgi:hypothetical protein